MKKSSRIMNEVVERHQAAIKASERLIEFHVDFDKAGEKSIEVKVPVEAIWKAITEHLSFMTLPDIDQVDYLTCHYFSPNS